MEVGQLVVALQPARRHVVHGVAQRQIVRPEAVSIRVAEACQAAQGSLGEAKTVEQAGFDNTRTHPVSVIGQVAQSARPLPRTTGARHRG